MLIRKNNRFEEPAKVKLIVLAYRNNIDLLTFIIDKFSVDVQYIFAALNDVQKEQFLKAKVKNDQQNMPTYSEPLNLDFFLRNVISIIKNKTRDDKINSKRNVSMRTLPHNRRFLESSLWLHIKRLDS